MKTFVMLILFPVVLGAALFAQDFDHFNPGWPGVVGTYSTGTVTNAYITATVGSTTRNNATGSFGFKFVPSVNMHVTALGRWVVSGNTHSHTIWIKTNGCTLVTGAITNVATSGATTNQFDYQVLAATVQLYAGGTYYIESGETNGADAWYDYTQNTISAHPNGSVSDTSNACSGGGGTNTSYVPANFLYTVP